MLTQVVLDSMRIPRRIAVIGASRDDSKLSGKPLRYLSRFGYRGEIVPISTASGVVQGYPARRSLAPGDDVDLALVAVPAREVADALLMCRDAGVRSTVVFAGGFGELGESGAVNQGALDRLSGFGPGRMRIFGPNCLGFTHLATGVAATFGSVLDEFELVEGSTALITQSGGFGSAVLGAANAVGLGCSWWVSTGNEFDVSLAEVLGALIEEEDVERVLVCTEGLRDGEEFVRAAIRARELGKPIVLLNAGRSLLGARAAVSHTGTIAGSGEVLQGIARQLGVIAVASLEQLLDVGRALAFHPRGARGPVTIVTVSGGAGVIAVDVCSEFGVELAEWDASSQRVMAEGLSGNATVRNPIDVTATRGSSAFSHAIRTAAAHPGTGQIIALLANRRADEPTRSALLGEIQESTDKPVIVSWTAASGALQSSLAQNGVAAYSDPTRAVAAAAALSKVGENFAQLASCRTHHGSASRSDEVPQWRPAWVKRQDGSRILDDVSSRALLTHYRIDLPEECEVADEHQAADAARQLGFPVVLKARSTEVLHRSDAGLVRLGLMDEDAVRVAFREIWKAASGIRMGQGGFVVQQQIPRGTELLAGVTTDAAFGTVMAIGTGGTLAELVADAVMFVPPVSAVEAARLISSVRAVRFLGRTETARAALGALAEVVSKISHLVSDHRAILAEADLNPIVVTLGADGTARCTAVDWLFLGAHASS